LQRPINSQSRLAPALSRPGYFFLAIITFPYYYYYYIGISTTQLLKAPSRTTVLDDGSDLGLLCHNYYLLLSLSFRSRPKKDGGRKT
jgi:hypothetical protein